MKNVVGQVGGIDHWDAMEYALALRPDLASWDTHIIISKAAAENREVRNAGRLRAVSEGSPRNTFLVCHEPPDNAGTGTLVADRVRRCNEGDGENLCYYVFPQSEEGMSRGYHNGCPVIRCKPDNFQALVDKYEPVSIEVHHLIGWPFSILAARPDRTTLYLHDSYLWCFRAHLMRYGTEICPGPEPARCADCIGVTPEQVSSAWEEKRKHLAGLKGIYANSAYTLELAKKYLPEGLDIQLYEFPVPDLAHYRKRVRIGYFGYWSHTKGIHTLLDAFKNVNGAQLILFCAVPDDVREGNGIYGYPNTLVFGPYWRGHLSRCANLVDFAVVPSHVESFGLVGRELRELNVPCITTHTGGQTGTIPPDDPEALRKEIQEWVDAYA
jgi:glycosyltransferase involved in cell wall biosynthesis